MRRGALSPSTSLPACCPGSPSAAPPGAPPGRAAGVILEHRNFVKKLVFAVETLPVNLVVSGLVTEFFAILLYCGFLLIVRHDLPLTVLWLPLLLVPQLLFTAGLSWFLAALGVFVRDLGQFIGFLLT